MVIRGDLLSVDLSNVFQMLAMNRKRGVLHIHNRENVLEKRALFLDADRVGIVRIPESQDLAAILVDQGVLDYDTWRDAHQKGLQFGVAPSNYILKRGIVTPEQIAAAESRLQEELVLEIFLWKNVAFSLDEEAIPGPCDKRQMFVLDLMVMEAARRQDEWIRVIELLGGGRGMWRYREDADYGAARFTDVDRIVLDHLDGVHGTPEIMRSTGLPRYQVDSSIGSLVEQGIVDPMELNDLLDVGDQLAEGGYHGEAIRLYQCAIRHDRKSIALHKRLASCYLKEGRVAKSGAHYKFCAMMLLENDLAREALAIYQYVATVLPTDFHTIEVALGLIARLGGPSTKDDERTIELASKLCQFYHDCRLLERAEDILKDLLEVDPSNNAYGFMLARLQTKTGRIGDAVATYMKLAGRL
ncbi:MAG: DUF4388 domain-containing protein, partial [Planctomycetes bacterium]|nr:DUF4388 domain-containing protein [Planctomycetota bacterium]